jgi:ribose-phosphate pyrophosphokinase
MFHVFKAGEELKVDVKTFAGGEENVAISVTKFKYETKDFEPLTLVANLRSSSEVMQLLLITDSLRRMYPAASIDLVMPYIPYARQDRVCNGGEALSIKVFTDLINMQGYEGVTVWDPHSDVAPALLERCKIISPSFFLDHLPEGSFDSKTVFVSPDAGANKKVFQVVKDLRITTPVIRADKIRDTKTGFITDTVVYGDVEGKHAFIVDDICDGGRTFIALAKQLKAAGASKVSLYVTHGIFSYGVDILGEHIDAIYSPNIWEENVKDRDSKSLLRQTVHGGFL